jgi:hypothetical protein
MTARARRSVAHLAAVLLALLTLAPMTAAAASAPVVVGIVLRETGPAFAVLQDPLTSRTGFYGVGARVGDAVVKEILADRVILATGNQQTHLRLGTPVSSDRGSPLTTAPAPTTSGLRRGAGSGGAVVQPPASPYGTIATVTAPAGPASWGGPTGGTGGSASPMAGLGQAGGPAAGAEGTQNALGASLTITGHLHGGGSVQGDQFSTTSLRDLLIAMSYSNVTRPHRQRLEFYAPDGSLYQKLTGAVAPSTQTLIPVGGTWITEHSLFGGWRVDVYVDRETTPIVSHPFTLTP